MPETDLKPGEYAFRDPKTLQPHPMSVALYLNGIHEWSIVNRLLSQLEASNEIMEKMDVTDLLDSIKRDGIRVPLVITPAGTIISGCRRWKAAMLLDLTAVPVEVRIFPDETDEKLAIVDYNRYREKTVSQKMKEAELLKELTATRAKKKMLTGKSDPALNLVEGSGVKRYERETAAIVGSRVGMGKDTFRKVQQIWNKAKEGNQKAIEMVEKLDENKTSINAAFNTLKKAEENVVSPPLSRLQLAEPVGSGQLCTCQHCGKTYQILHCKSGKHRLMESPQPDNSGATKDVSYNG